MKLKSYIILFLVISSIMISCKQTYKETTQMHTPKNVTAKDILGNPNYLAISYGGYRAKSRDSQPTIPQLKEDMKLLSAMGIKLIRTYNVQLPHATNVLKAITELKKDLEKYSNIRLYYLNLEILF